jgi:nucleoside-diphosphate-sugar epimerase
MVHLANYQSDSDDNDDDAGSLLGPPREAITSSPKAGLLESLLEHLYQHSNETGRAPPHFTYASSVQVYPRHAATAGSGAVPVVPWTENDAFQPQEQMQITMTEVPSTWYGASRLLDERLAEAYYDMYRLYSVGLRFSTIYGPAADPTTHIHQLAQRAVVAASSRTSTSTRSRSGETNATPHFSLPDMHPNDARDYIYIDDAVDAILSVRVLLSVWTVLGVCRSKMEIPIYSN